MDSDSSKKRRKFQLTLKKLHKSFRKARPSNPAEAAITGAGSVSSQSEAGMKYIFEDLVGYWGSRREGLIVVTLNAPSHGSRDGSQGACE